jgi:hypothetical protein
MSHTEKESILMRWGKHFDEVENAYFHEEGKLAAPTFSRTHAPSRHDPVPPG